MNTDFVDKLGLQALLKVKDNTWNGKDYLDLKRLVTSDVRVIEYRLDALSDLLENPKLLEAVTELLPKICVLQESRSLGAASGNEISNLYAVRDVNIYIELVDTLYNAFESSNIRSELFTELSSEVSEIVNDNDYNRMKENVPKNTEIITTMQSVTIGVNLDSGLHPIDAGIVSINTERFRPGNIVDKLLRMDGSDKFQCVAPLAAVGKNFLNEEERQNFNTSIGSGLFKIIKHSIKAWKPTINSYISQNTGFIHKFYTDLRFLSSAADFFIKLKQMGYPVTRPVICDAEEKKFTVREAYNPDLVLNGVSMIGNDISFNEDGMIYIFTGANSGGKTVFLKTVAICQALFQLGLFVPAGYAEISPANELLLHLSLSSGKGMQSRFTEECEKLSAIMHMIDQNTMILCDEALSGTSSYEAAGIAEEVLRVMSAKGCRGIFVTHIHELSMLPDTINCEEYCRSKLNNMTVDIDEESGRRLYKITIGRSLGKSFASDIAEKYGLSFKQLMSG